MLLMQFLLLLLNSQKSLFSVVKTKAKKKINKKRATTMSQHNRSVTLFEIILQANGVNAVLKYN